MSILATSGVIHQIEKKRNGVPKFNQNPPHPTGDDLNDLISIIEGRFAKNKAYSFFSEEKIVNKKGFSFILDAYLKDAANNFDTFGEKIGISLVHELSKNSAKLATGEHLMVCDYVVNKDRCCLVALISLSEGRSINQGVLTDIEYIESSKLKQAVKINIDGYRTHVNDIANKNVPKNDEDQYAKYQYLEWLAFASDKDVVDYLQDLMSPEHKINDSTATSAIRKATKSYSSQKDKNDDYIYSESERAEIDFKIVEMLSNNAKNSLPVYLSDIDDLFDVYNKSKNKQTQSFQDWRAQHSPNLESGFTPSKTTTARWTKFKFSTGSGIKINAEVKNIEHGEIDYKGKGEIVVQLKNDKEVKEFESYWCKMNSH